MTPGEPTLFDPVEETDVPAVERDLASGARLDFGHLRDDVAAVAAMKRGSAAADKPQVAWIEGRLRDSAAHEIRTESFRFSRRPWRYAAHGVAGAGAAALGGPAGALLAGGALCSLEADVSGRSRWSSRFFPRGEGVNVSARIPAGGPPERTLLFVAHHDAARTGVLWRMPRPKGPFMWPVECALAAVGIGCLAGSRVLRAAGAAVVSLMALLALDIACSEVVPGANDNATGVAAALAIAGAFARDPLERTDVALLFTDCEEVGLGGIAAWLTAHASELDSARTLVVGLDTLGSGVPAVVSSDGAVTARFSADAGNWADRGALRAGVDPPRRVALVASSDVIVARHAGLRAISIVSADRHGTLGPHYHRLSDTPDHVDHGSVESCARLAVGIARAWDAAS